MDPHQVDQIVDELAHRYATTFPPEQVRDVVLGAVDDLERSAKADTYLPLFTRRFALDELRHRAAVQEADRQGVHDILFICHGNADRSQMAAALVNASGDARVRAWSAGVRPLPEVLPVVRQVMQEQGVEMGTVFPKPVTDAVTRAADVIVAIGVVDADLPRTGRPVVHWDVGPVAGRDHAATRVARDALAERVRHLLDDVLR